MPSDPLNGLGLMEELNLSLEKSGNFILSGKWQPCLKLIKNVKHNLHHTFRAWGYFHIGTI